jgi:dynein heavy chain
MLKLSEVQLLHYRDEFLALSLCMTGVRLPSAKSVYSYFVDLDSGNFIAWDALIPSTNSLIEKGAVITLGESLGVGGAGHGAHKAGGGEDGNIVPTVDTVRYSFLCGLLLLNKHPVLLTGGWCLRGGGSMALQ